MINKRKWTDKNPAKEFDRILKKALTEVGIVVEGQAIAMSPVVTGRLRGSITYQTQTGGDKVRNPARDNDAINRPGTNNEVWVGTNVEYGPYIEYGTRRSAAQPFLRPAIDRKKKQCIKILQEVVDSEYGK